MTNTKRDSSSLNILRKKFSFFSNQVGGKKHKRKRIEIAVAPWSFLIQAQCIILQKIQLKMELKNHFFSELQGWTNFASLWKMAVGKGFLGLWLSPIFRRGNKCEFISRPSITNGNSIPGAGAILMALRNFFFQHLLWEGTFQGKHLQHFLHSLVAIFEKVANDMTCTRCHIQNMDVSTCWVKKLGNIHLLVF